jgi:hypothetical protein
LQTPPHIEPSRILKSRLRGGRALETGAAALAPASPAGFSSAASTGPMSAMMRATSSLLTTDL